MTNKNKLNIGLVFFSGGEYGLGHHFRSLVLAEELQQRGHYVWALNNLQYHHDRMYFQLRDGYPDDLYHILDQLNLDWLIIDLPEVKEYYYKLSQQFNTKTMFINADGDNNPADISIVQGCLNGAHSGVEWVILRPELKQIREMIKNRNTWKKNNWFVFGGSIDNLQLLEYFQKVVPDDKASLVHYYEDDHPDLEITSTQTPYSVSDIVAMTALMAKNNRACISFGMTAWELVYMRIPTYVFSLTEKHLEWAIAMANEGLIQAYPSVGLPSQEDFLDFTQEPFNIAENKLDLQAASRIANLLEEAN